MFETRKTRKLLAQFGSAEFPPVLDSRQQQSAQRYLAAQGLRMGFGVLPVGAEDDIEPTPTEVLMGHDSEAKQALDTHSNAIIGPYFLEGEYYESGIGIWISEPVETAPAS